MADIKSDLASDQAIMPTMKRGPDVKHLVERYEKTSTYKDKKEKARNKQPQKLNCAWDGLRYFIVALPEPS